MRVKSRRQFLKHSCLLFTGLSLFREKKVVSVPCSPAGVSLEEKIGQMLMVGFRGLLVDKYHSIIRDIVDRHIGGVVLFDYDVPSKSSVRNIESVSQLKSLVSSLQSFAKQPLLIAIDHEGGRVTRLKEKFGFPQTYSAQSLGQKNDPDFTLRQAESMARELCKLGINLNLAPVVDLNTNPANPIIGGLERSFSDSSDVVSCHAEKFIQGHHQHKVLCTLKHYPGHGSSADDSHLGLVDISDSWTEAELQPYSYLIEKGLADAVMTAHVFNKHLDPTFPATLSKRIIHDLLRKKMGFEGVIFSDDLQMGAIANEFGLETAIFRTLDAGVDILAFANNSTFDPQIAAKALKIVKELVNTDKIPESRIDESWQRITKLKARWTDS